jgi:hypothetical protein
MLMAEAVSSSQINDLLIQIGRSLLQYVGESWPWSASGAEETRHTLQRLVDEQRESVAALVRLLVDRGEIIDFGTYPTEYTSLHYVAVDFLLDKLVQNQEMVVRASDSLAREAANDPDTAETLRDIAARARKHLDELRRLVPGT